MAYLKKKTSRVLVSSVCDCIGRAASSDPSLTSVSKMGRRRHSVDMHVMALKFLRIARNFFLKPLSFIFLAVEIRLNLNFMKILK